MALAPTRTLAQLQAAAQERWLLPEEVADILTNCRRYPRDEAPSAYKDFEQVVQSVESAGLAKQVARLHARFVIKDASAADD